MATGKDAFRDVEAVHSTRLNPLLPCVMRLDGRSFSKMAKGLERPFDEAFVNAMNQVAIALAEGVDDCVLAYVQSDEVSLVLSSKPPQTPWFSWRVQKMTSVAASIASVAFYRAMAKAGPRYEAVMAARPPAFDARVMSLPADLVADYLSWRQTDATRNALAQAAYHVVGAKRTHGMRARQMHEALFEMGVNFDDYPPRLKRGAVVFQQVYEKLGHDPTTNTDVKCTRRRWVLDEDAPVFERDPSYLEERLAVLER